jgi:hypothetical protein
LPLGLGGEPARQQRRGKGRGKQAASQHQVSSLWSFFY